MVSVNKDPKEGVEYITGADGVKRPMAYYKAAEERARMENPLNADHFSTCWTFNGSCEQLTGRSGGLFYCHHKSHSLQSGFDNGLYPTRDNLTDIPFNG